MQPCRKHGVHDWCYVNEDYRHVDVGACTCETKGRAGCLVDDHRLQGRWEVVESALESGETLAPKLD